jgi:hypothetical protein
LDIDEIYNIEEWQDEHDLIPEWFDEADADDDEEIYFKEFVDLLFIREDAIFHANAKQDL